MQLIRIALAVIAFTGTAQAFPTGDQFDHDPVTMDGGGGIAFDGSPRHASHTCAVCHVGAPGQINIRLESDHPELFVDGWQPNTQYHVRVVLLGAHAGADYTKFGDDCGDPDVTPYRPCDQNGFALELDDAGGKPAGKYTPYDRTCTTTSADPAIRVLADGTAVTHRGLHYGVTQWDLCWTSPAAGTGTITAYVAAVDGNGGNGTPSFPNDPIGDDVAAGAIPLVELGGEVPDQTGGCNAAGAAGLAPLALVLALLSGCVHVRPRQRETLARKNMKFAPDPAEDELDLHMQESREGSSGGYGSSGGGCGCN